MEVKYQVKMLNYQNLLLPMVSDGMVYNYLCGGTLFYFQ